ncbi:MAG: hypothetical protein ABEH64_07015 [Salinirussus sp.]
MASTNVRACLRRACEEIDHARDGDAVSDPMASRLEGVARQLRYFVEGHDMDPEAHARPDPRAMDSIHDRLQATAESTEDATAEKLESACEEVKEAIEILEQRQRRQREGP